MRAVSFILILGLLSSCASVNTQTDAAVHTAGAVADAGVLAGVGAPSAVPGAGIASGVGLAMSALGVIGYLIKPKPSAPVQVIPQTPLGIGILPGQLR